MKVTKEFHIELAGIPHNSAATIYAGKTQTFILAVDTLGILDKHGLLNEYHLRTAGQCKSLLVPRGYTMYFSARTTVLV